MSNYQSIWSYLPKNIELSKIQIVMICETLPGNMGDYFYSSSGSLYVTNTIEAFNSAGLKVENITDIINKGVYLTVAVKEPRKELVISTDIIKKYSYSLEEELNMLPNIKVILLMGDVAIKSLNYISIRTNNTRVIPSGSTYKIRNREFYFRDIRVFPSYLQTGKNFLIEKSKRRMVSEDIKNAFFI